VISAKGPEFVLPSSENATSMQLNAIYLEMSYSTTTMMNTHSKLEQRGLHGGGHT
jgi:hypothetical protein